MVRALLTVLRDAASVFAPRNLPWHLLAIGLTYVCVISGLDAWVAATSKGTQIRELAHLAGWVGLWTPIVLPPAMLAIGRLRRDERLLAVGWRLAEAEVLAAAICATYKVFTGRPGPSQWIYGAGGDLSHVFRFGILRGGVFWGWPSSHVMVAVAGSVALSLLCAPNRAVRWIALTYAAWMAVSVSVSFHWFSDVVAAVIIGTVIGRVVGRPRDGVR